jgi:hypothetical protein
MNDERRVVIVRIWWERDPQLAAPLLRGSIQLLGTAELHYFDSSETLLALLQDALTTPPARHLTQSDEALTASNQVQPKGET